VAKLYSLPAIRARRLLRTIAVDSSDLKPEPVRLLEPVGGIVYHVGRSAFSRNFKGRIEPEDPPPNSAA
jgi:hypothetical protein